MVEKLAGIDGNIYLSADSIVVRYPCEGCLIESCKYHEKKKRIVEFWEHV